MVLKMGACLARIYKYSIKNMKKNQSSRPSPFHKNKANPAEPIRDKEEVAQNPDNKIDQDFPGYPHEPASEKTIRPQSKEDHLTAGTIKKNGGSTKNRKNNTQSEMDSDGSANAFDRTELGEGAHEDPANDNDNSPAY